MTVLTILDRLDRFGPFWTVWTVWKILDQFGPFCTVWAILDNLDHFGPFGPFWTVWTILDCLDHFGPFGPFLENVQEWARTELAKTEMSEYLPKVQNTVVEQKQGSRIRPVRTKSPDEGFESGGDDEDSGDCSAKRKETMQINCDQDETTKAVSEPRKIFLMVPTPTNSL